MKVSLDPLELILISYFVKHLNVQGLDEGMFPLKEFTCKPRYTKLKQFPIVVGISLEKLFLETSSESIFFKPSTSTGNLPLNEL